MSCLHNLDKMDGLCMHPFMKKLVFGSISIIVTITILIIITTRNVSELSVNQKKNEDY